jgi:hypothetical protein
MIIININLLKKTLLNGNDNDTQLFGFIDYFHCSDLVQVKSLALAIPFPASIPPLSMRFVPQSFTIRLYSIFKKNKSLYNPLLRLGKLYKTRHIYEFY